MKVALCCIGRLENQYAVEYVEYYKKLGFDKIFIYDNNHDGEEHFEDALQSYIDDGFVTVIGYRNKEAAQLSAYNDCYSKYGNEYDWIAFFDFDEFLTLVKDKDIKAYLRHFEGFQCVKINWMVYTDNDLVINDHRPLLERFTTPMEYDNYAGCPFPTNNHVKSIVSGRINNFKWSGTPHTPNMKIKYCDSVGNKSSKSPFIQYNFSNAYIKHFITKTIDEWMNNKKKRGVADRTYEVFNEKYNIDDFFKINNRTIEKTDYINKAITNNMKKYAVITFLFNHYDLLREPLVIDENADYYCLTDDKELKSDNWKCIYIDDFNTDELTGIQKTYMCKYSFYKRIPNEYEYYITIDGSIEVADKLTPIIEYAENNGFDIGLSMHPTRTKWSDEYSEWEKYRGLKHEYVEAFYKYAKSFGFDPEADNGLIECTMKVYKNNNAVKGFIDDVYETLKDTMDFNDSNEQCYFTCVYSKHMDNMKTFFFTRQLYSNSDYFNSYFHKTNNKWINDVNIKDNTNMLFGKKIELVEFTSKKNNVDIFIGTQKTFKPAVTNNAYKIIVGNHEIENESNLELINCKHDSELDDKFYSELYMLDYVSKNIELKKYVGFCHNRRYFSFLNDIPELDEIFSKYDCIVAKPIMQRLNVKMVYAGYHNIEDLFIVGGIIADKYPQHANAWHNFINGNVFVPYNMFIMKQEDFKEYIKFIFDILDEYLRIVGTDINKRIYDNYEKYIKDFYPNDTVEYQYRIGGYIGERLTNVFLLSKFKKMKTYPVILTEDKYNKKG